MSHVVDCLQVEIVVGLHKSEIQSKAKQRSCQDDKQEGDCHQHNRHTLENIRKEVFQIKGAILN